MPEEVEGLAEAVLGLILPEDHVVWGGGGHEDDGGDVVEALDPLPSLVPLAAHVKHVELHPVHAELRGGGASPTIHASCFYFRYLYRSL